MTDHEPREDKELEVTPTHLLKPNLQWIGRLLGMDVYIDTQHKKKRALAEKLLAALTDPDKEQNP